MQARGVERRHRKGGVPEAVWNQLLSRSSTRVKEMLTACVKWPRNFDFRTGPKACGICEDKVKCKKKCKKICAVNQACKYICKKPKKCKKKEKKCKKACGKDESCKQEC